MCIPSLQIIICQIQRKKSTHFYDVQFGIVVCNEPVKHCFKSVRTRSYVESELNYDIFYFFVIFGGILQPKKNVRAKCNLSFYEWDVMVLLFFVDSAFTKAPFFLFYCIFCLFLFLFPYKHSSTLFTFSIFFTFKLG